MLQSRRDDRFTVTNLRRSVRCAGFCGGGRLTLFGLGSMTPGPESLARGAASGDARTKRRYAEAMYYESFMQMKKMLGQLDKWLDAGEAYAKEKSFDPNLFVSFRLAPDQFAFARQVQSACDTAKLGSSRLSGKEAPKHADTEQ